MPQKNSKQSVVHDLIPVTYGFKNKVYLSNRTTDNLSFTQRLKLVSRLAVHNGCVNTISWNDTGQYILSGSDDQHLVVADPFTGKVEVSLHSAHRANIFSAKFLPNTQNKQTISCSADGLIYYYDFEQRDLLSVNGFDCHLGAVYEVLTVPNDSYTFLSCGEDGTVRWFDLRTKTRCNKANCEDDIMINTRQAVMSLAINPMKPFELAIGCADSAVRVYDRRQLSTGATGADTSRSGAMLHFFSAPTLKKRNHRITSLSYSDDGEELLVSYSSEHLYLFNFKNIKGENQIPLRKSFKEFDDAKGASVNDDRSVAATGSSSCLSDAATSGECIFRPCTGRQPPVKRLRLRGDWSDTGPNARPERERERASQDETASSIMQRMSNMLTRLLEGRMRQENTEQQPSNEATTSQEPEQRIEPGLSPDEVDGTDGDNTTAESSLSSSVASSALFVSCSTSDRDVSTEDFEMSECTCADQCSNETEMPLTLPLHPGYTPEQATAPEISCEKNEDEMITDEKQFVSGNQSVDETAMLEAMPSLSERCGNVASSSNDFTEKSFDCCSDDGGGGVTVTVKSVSFPELICDDASSIDRGSKLDLSREDVIAEPADVEATAIGVTRGQLRCSRSNETEATTDEGVEASSRPELVSGHQLRPPQTTEGVAAAEDLKVATFDEKVLDEADVLVTQRVTEDFDLFQITSDGGRNNQADCTSSSTNPVAAERSPVTSTPSSEIVLPSQDPAGDADVGGRDGGLREEALGLRSTGRIERQGTSASTASYSANMSNAARSSNSDHSDDDSDFEEASYTTPASRRNFLKERLEEKNAAASKLQAVFRQHMEEKIKNREAGLSLPKPSLKQCYMGHRNSRTMIKEATFWGRNYVMSGSDCGHIFIWDRQTARLVMLMEGDRHVVNCLQPHPYYPILASSGIDYDVKIWMPMLESPSFDYPKAAELMRRNEVMLEETRDTLTVPASFMLRMLLSLNHARRGGRLGGSGRERSSSHDSSASSRDE